MLRSGVDERVGGATSLAPPFRSACFLAVYTTSFLARWVDRARYLCPSVGAMAETKPTEKLAIPQKRTTPTGTQRMLMYWLISGHSLCIYTIRAFVVRILPTLYARW